MPAFPHAPIPPSLAIVLSGLALAALAGCGGGGETAPPPPTPSTALVGTVAVGAPIVDGTLRVLDADGNVVAHDVPIDADGRYSGVTLTGNGPWRLEACGYAGGNWRCIYAVAQAAGTANVTPLTTAQVTLATGVTPESLMQAGGAMPTADALAAAQQQLQAGLSSTLADAGLSGTIDFTTNTLTAGSRTGYDRILDAISVTTGTDNGAFVQLQPRLGDGNLYMTTAGTSGAITPAAGAAGLSLAGLETLFTGMSAAMASADACASGPSALQQWMASDARMNMGGMPMSGAADVAAGMCMFFGGAGGHTEPLWGSHLDSPTLGHCDFSGADPVCAISFVLHGIDGSVETVGDGMGVVYRGGTWLFRGDLLPIEIHANAAVQRTHRIDDGSESFYRALQFDIANTPGVACALVLQRDAGGAPIPVAYYKVHEAGASRMSLWVGTSNDGASLDPAAGATRSNDDTWVPLPEGVSGDEVVRNFYRGGRTVNVALFADAACATPATIDGRSEFTVDVQGVPPVWAALPLLPWGDLTADTQAALQSFTLGANVAGSFDVAWGFTEGVTGYDQVTFCVDGSCGEGSAGRIGDLGVRPIARAATVPLRGPVAAIGAGSFKLVALFGRDASGMGIQANYVSCSDTPAGQFCH
jgi:hypothetical protein